MLDSPYVRHAAPDTRRAKVLVLVIADTVLLTDGMPPTAGHLQFARRVLLSGLIN